MERRLALGVWVVVSTLGAVRGDSIQSQDPELSRTEGDSVTIRCSYSSNSDYVFLYWYRQYPNRAPQYILYRGAKSLSSQSNTADFARNRSSSLADHSTTVLNITALEWADTAMYYCALAFIRTGGYSDKLIFGNGTRLQVEPKSDPAPPSVLLMKSKPVSGKQVKAACLAKDFYPKEVKMNFVNHSVVYQQDEPVVSQNGKYNTIKVVQINDTEDVDCVVDHQGQQYRATVEKTAAEQPKTMPTFCAPSNSTAAEENPETVNMLSVTVLGLRVLFAKTLAFNTLMTIKLFVF